MLDKLNISNPSSKYTVIRLKFISLSLFEKRISSKKDDRVLARSDLNSLSILDQGKSWVDEERKGRPFIIDRWNRVKIFSQAGERKERKADRGRARAGTK